MDMWLTDSFILVKAGAPINACTSNVLFRIPDAPSPNLSNLSLQLICVALPLKVSSRVSYDYETPVCNTEELLSRPHLEGL